MRSLLTNRRSLLTLAAALAVSFALPNAGYAKQAGPTAEKAASQQTAHRRPASETIKKGPCDPDSGLNPELCREEIMKP